jgi:hypothetical protein
MAKEILEAWFATQRGTAGDDGVRRLQSVDARHRGKPSAT